MTLNNEKDYDANPEDMEELMKESSFALSDTPFTVCQLVIALQNHLMESYCQDHHDNCDVNYVDVVQLCKTFKVIR